MAIDDDGSSEAVGAEKNPRNVRRFVWFLMLGILVFLGVALIVLHTTAPVVQH